MLPIEIDIIYKPDMNQKEDYSVLLLFIIIIIYYFIIIIYYF